MDATQGVKVLFLDIDGVLNNGASSLLKVGNQLATPAQLKAWLAIVDKVGHDDEMPYGPTHGFFTIDPLAVRLINRLLEKEPQLRVVLSSSHRSFFSSSNYQSPIEYGSAEHLGVLTQYLTSLGINVADRLIGITPRLHVRRGLEILNWLRDYQGPEILCHAAVDDEASIYPAETTLVRTNAKIGLTIDEYFELCKVLCIHESPLIY